jgi:uncharacterized membrane protein YhaH (DUF805 family)
VKSAGMTPINWALRPLHRYADFSGRAPRAEYWWFSLAATLLSVVGAFIDRRLFSPIYGDLGPLGLIQVIALFLPGVTVIVRRLHDIDKSGWWFFLNIWVYAGLLSGSFGGAMKSLIDRLPTGVGFVLVLAFMAAVAIFFVFMIMRGTERPNRYGPDPYGPSDLEEVFA